MVNDTAYFDRGNCDMTHYNTLINDNGTAYLDRGNWVITYYNI